MSPFAAGQQGARLQKAKSDYGKMMANRQPGGYSSIPSQGKKDAFVQAQRQKFFDNRPDVSEDRIFRRTRQEGGIDQFKQALIDKGRVLTGTRADGSTYTVMNPNTGEPVFLTDRPGGRSVSDVAQDLAFRFGPTPSEIASDMGYAIGSMGKGLGQFISKGGVIGNVLSGLYDKFKGGTQQGIETVKGLYDNLRTTLSGQPTVTYGGGSTMVTTSGGQPRVDLTPTSITTETLPAMNLNRNIGDESDPSIFGITNTGVPLPFLRSTVDNPNLINVLPQGGGYLPEGFSNTLPPYPRFFDYFSSNAGVAPIVPLYKSGGSVDKYAGLGYKLK